MPHLFLWAGILFSAIHLPPGVLEEVVAGLHRGVHARRVDAEGAEAGFGPVRGFSGAVAALLSTGFAAEVFSGVAGGGVASPQAATTEPRGTKTRNKEFGFMRPQ